MPLRCVTGQPPVSILAFDLSCPEWEALSARNRQDRHLRMPCCGAQVVLRTSPLGTHFFAHKAREGTCSGPETEA